MRSATGRAEAALALLVLLAGCTSGDRSPPRPVAVVPAAEPVKPEVAPAKPAVVRPGTVKIGKPYQVFGVSYYPADDRNYDERGIASWYGPGFHALDTANGERYEQDDVTAAHKTLPMPSYVEVENLDNGRKLTVRINDRGPFVAGRIIDLSRRSAQLLGVDRAGTARVRVRRVFPDAATQTRLAPPAAPPPLPAIVESVAVPAVTSVAISAAPALIGDFVQVAALSDPGRIAWLTGYLGAFGPVVTERTPAGLTRVRLGPYAQLADANAVLAQLRIAGYSDARLVSVKSKP
ncbi:MAG: septal ring lytic transglycosylase RlpA family protein [Polymorphobacter sp.]